MPWTAIYEFDSLLHLTGEPCGSPQGLLVLTALWARPPGHIQQVGIESVTACQTARTLSP